VDQDGSEIARGTAAGLASDAMLDARPSTLEEAREDVRRGRIAVAIVIPPGFGEAARAALFRPVGKPEVPLLYDPSHASERALVEGVLSQHVMQAVSRHAFSHGGPAMTLPYSVRSEAIAGRSEVPYNGYAHSFAGMSVQFILFAGINMGVAMLVDRQRGVWKRLRAAPLSKGFVLGARTLSGALIGFATLSVVFAAAVVIFGVRVQGSLLGFVGVLAAFAVMASTFGLLIAALGRTPEATRGVSIFAVLIMVMLGGAWVPTFLFPAWMQRATLAVPTRWAVDGIEAMTWRGLPLGAALPSIGVLLGFALVFEALAILRFRWEAE
jgi:ABC-2 type transport system permease protein